MLTGYFLPGFKSGGILRNVINTIDNLTQYCEFKIITRDRDLGDSSPYEGEVVGDWVKVKNASVYRLPKGGESLFKLRELIKSTPCDIIFLTSFFDSLTVKFLLIRFFSKPPFKRVIVAPFGEFAWASFQQKIIKKLIFVVLARLIGLYNGVIWRVSSEFEAKDLTRVISPPKDSIMVTGDLPASFEESSQLDLHDIFSPLSFPVDLKIIFLSRISREKNLDLALQMLMKVEACIVFDIYGPIEDASYWLKCQKMILELPPNITVRYCKIVPPSKILGTFSAYDLFLFPTGGEAYGNVIAESLIAGTQVLISKNTPWRNLEVDSLGWDIDLNMIDSFVDIIEAVALTSSSDRLIKRDQVKNSVNLRLTDSWVLESNLKLLGIRCYEK